MHSYDRFALPSPSSSSHLWQVVLVSTAVALITLSGTASAEPSDARSSSSSASGDLPVLVDITIKAPAQKTTKKKAKKSSRARSGKAKAKGSYRGATSSRAVGLRQRRGSEMPPEPDQANRRVRSSRAVNAVIRNHMSEIGDCHQRMGRKQRAGEVTLAFTITPSGRPTRIALATSHGRFKALERCVNRRVKRWRFPAADEPSKVEYPIYLTVAGR
ncbi:MAG: TonB family protein [Myxococcota bacterium]